MRNIKFKYLEVLFLIFIIFLGGFLYLYKLESLPPGLYLDEAGTGYNIYSILKTGMDEYGKTFPIAFRLFGSYTPPLYIYLSVPLMAIFGFSVLTTRLLSAICGIIGIIVVFLLIKEFKITKSKYTPLVATLFFAITPWTIFFSRMGYEQNLAFLLLSLSILLITKAFKNPKILLFTLPVLSITTYADYAQRLVVPLLFVAVFIFFRKKLKGKIDSKYLYIGALVAFLIQLPNLYILFTPSFFTKNDHFYFDVVAGQSTKISHFLPNFISLPLSFLREFLSQFLTYFSPKSLFFLPDSDLQRSMPELSVFYSWMIIPYLFGLYAIGRNKKQLSTKFILFLLLITPLPGALTRQPFHIQRTLSMLLPLTLVMAMGIDKLITNKKLRIWFPVASLLLVFSLIMFWRSYFVLLPQERSDVWGFQYKILADYIKGHPNDTFLIDQSTRTRPQDVAYAQMAFYLKLDPKELQKDQKPDLVKNYYTDIEFNFIHKFANVETRQIEWGETGWRDIVIVGDDVSISDPEVKLHNLTQVFEIKDPNNVIVLRGFKTNPKKIVKPL